jgi:hypothetical protein
MIGLKMKPCFVYRVGVGERRRLLSMCSVTMRSRQTSTLVKSPNTGANWGNKMGSAPLSPQYTFPFTLGQLLEAMGGIPI